MSKRIVNDCDRCGKEIKAHHTVVSRAVDCTRDGTGDSDTHWETVDLCAECTATALSLLIDGNVRTYDYKQNIALVAFLRNRDSKAPILKPLESAS